MPIHASKTPLVNSILDPSRWGGGWISWIRDQHNQIKVELQLMLTLAISLMHTPHQPSSIEFSINFQTQPQLQLQLSWSEKTLTSKLTGSHPIHPTRIVIPQLKLS